MKNPPKPSDKRYTAMRIGSTERVKFFSDEKKLHRHAHRLDSFLLKGKNIRRNQPARA